MDEAEEQMKNAGIMSAQTDVAVAIAQQRHVGSLVQTSVGLWYQKRAQIVVGMTPSTH